METIRNVLSIIGWAAIIIAIIVGWFPPDPPKKKKKKTDKPPKELYCFECEIEMPVKEKNGRFFCSNCGLIH